MSQRWLRRVRRWLRAKRRSAIPQGLMETIQQGTIHYAYKGIPALKSPFDMALYQLLLWELKPATVLEIGSHRGGSALWLADTLRAMDLDCPVHSVDLNPVEGVAAPGLTFHVGDARALAEVFTADFLRSLPHPLLVIEDADHQADTTLAVLRFFAPWLTPGDYMVIEDGMVGDIGLGHRYGGGPCVAIERFLAEEDGRYEVDRRYCDWYGRNVTWNVNGYLRRTGAAPKVA